MYRYSLLALALVCALAGSLSGCGWGGRPPLASASAAAPVASLADAASLGYTAGANRVSWAINSPHVLAVIVYRIVNGQNVPIAVVPPSITWYIDAGAVPVANKLTAGTTAYKMAITTTSPVPFFTTDTAIPSATQSVDITQPLPAALATAVAPTASGTEVDVTALNLPLLPGQIVSYRIQPLYWSYVPTTINSSGETIPSTTGLFLSNASAASANVLLLTPPLLSWPPVGGSLNGIYQCATVPGGATYVLQISADQAFTPADTLPMIVAAPSLADANIMEADISTAALLAAPQLQHATTIYARMGVKSASSPAPVAQSHPNDNGYVFSLPTSFPL